MSSLEKKLRSRKNNEKIVDEFTEDVKKRYTVYHENDLTYLKTVHSTIEKKLEKYLQLSEEISEELQDEEQLFQDTKKASDYEVRVKNELLILSNFIKSKEPTDNISTVTVESRNSNQKSVRLPKLEIERFDGDPVKWKSFFDSFNSTIHENENLSNVEKMSYLKSFLSDSAATTVSGLSLSNENYSAAIELLTNRFGNEHVLISSHMNKLLQVDSILSIRDTEGLRRIYDNIESQVRSLKNIGIKPEQYGSMLIPVLNSKLPDELTLIM